MTETIASLRTRIEKARSGVLRLKNQREEYITLLNKISNNIAKITDDITHNELSIEYLDEELKKLEAKITKEEE